ncbi:MAG: hypothetical protein E6I76_00930 [Chloroflexi bacterium]|nr:MAG: hypothetical protein E6I76_00930 [Chloroflexota bacterium]
MEGVRRHRALARWVGEGLVEIDFRAQAPESRVRRLQRHAGTVLSGLALSGGLGLAALALHHILSGG